MFVVAYLFFNLHLKVKDSKHYSNIPLLYFGFLLLKQISESIFHDFQVKWYPWVWSLTNEPNWKKNNYLFKDIIADDAVEFLLGHCGNIT